MSAMIVVAGTVCLDRVRQISGLPVIGGYVDVVPIGDFLGGEAANTACALSHWGAEVSLEGQNIGNDSAAESIRVHLAKIGLSARIASDAARETPYCEIFVDANGDRTMFGFGFLDLASAKPTWKFEGGPGDWFSLDQNLAASGAVALERALSMGMNIYLLDHFRPDCQIPAGSWWQCSTDWVGVPGDKNANQEWATSFAGKCNCHCILSDGALGFCYSACGEPARWYPSYRIPKVLDATGAGDIFRAGMLYGLAQNWSVADCLRLASAAGGLQCLSYGATGKLASIARIQGHIRSQPEISCQYD